MSTLLYTLTRHTVVTIVCFFSYTILSAQGKILDIRRSSTVDVVTQEKIEQFSYRNMTDVLRFSPGTHHLNSRQTTYDFNDPVIDKRIDRIMYDGQNNPAYIQSVTTNVSGVTVEAVEQIWRNKDLIQGYDWGNVGGKQWGQLYDSSRNQYTPANRLPQWQQRFTYTPPSAAEIQIRDVSGWKIKLAEIRSQPDGTISFPNTTYSESGKSELKRSKQGDIKITEEKIFDGRGVLREYYYRETYPDDFVYEEVTYYNCRSERIHFESTWYDDEDYEIEMIDIVYKNGKPAAGYRDIEDYDYVGQRHSRQYFNPEAQEFQFLVGDEWEYNDYVFNLKDYDDPCDNPDDFISFGVRLILEDSYERFSTIGGFVNYTHMLNQHWGITGDIGLTKGSQFNQDYTKLNIVAGPTWFPCSHAGLDDPFNFSAHLYLGISHLNSEYSSGSMSASSSSTGITSVIGLDGYYNINSRFAIKTDANLNLNFANNNTSKNYLFDLGIRMTF